MNDRTLIIGGGITGLSAAHQLHRRGGDFVRVVHAEGTVGPADPEPQ
ncbi:MAG: NAD(P)-binding protein [Acidimicrobiaceae bacterium]|nr:FAD-dependent oxidoreductase [Acidimicrobiia bacterium]MCY4492611.1 NAD(P)-binding protein [Acidimicrobiaceae bacterium]